jgi:hypothetical protein
LEDGDVYFFVVTAYDVEPIPLESDYSNEVFTSRYAPILAWTGEPNYEVDGLHPEVGSGGTSFVYRIEYSDPDNDPPAVSMLWIDLDGDGAFNVGTEDFEMSATGSTYSTGVIYTLTTAIPFSAGSFNCSYYFEFSDGFSPAGGITAAISPATAINAPDVLQTLGVLLSLTTWDLGLIQADTVHQSSGITVGNTGDGYETFTLRISQESEGWGAGTANGPENYVLKAIFGSYFDNPDETHFKVDDVVSTAEVAASGSVFGDEALGLTGSAVSPGGQRALWFQFAAPTETSQTGLQTIQVTVGAQP